MNTIKNGIRYNFHPIECTNVVSMVDKKKEQNIVCKLLLRNNRFPFTIDYKIPPFVISAFSHRVHIISSHTM